MTVHSKKTMKILIVDDEPVLAQSLFDILSLYDYHVTKTVNGMDAIALLQNTHIDLVLLDLNMPGMSGFDVIDFVVENDLASKIIILSGDATFETAKKALKKGAHDFLKKPYHPDELLSIINNIHSRTELEKVNEEYKNKLAQSEQLHRFIVDNSPDIVFMLDQEDCITFINEAVNSILHFSRNSLIGEHISTLLIDKDVHLTDNFFSDVRRDNNPLSMIELMFKDNSGGYRHFEIHIMPVMLSESDNHSFQGSYCVAHDVTEKKKAQDLINYQAYHDLLTDLPNRYLLEDRIAVSITHAKRHQEKFALMFIDLDRFKWVNDTLGHTAGDHLLQEVGHRLRLCIREADTLARFGGDEFALILPMIRSRNDIKTIANKIISAFKRAFMIDGTELYITASIGIALYPEAGDSLESLIRNADMAMYSVKDKGKNAFEFFNRNTSRINNNLLTMETELRHALVNNELSVSYQPKVETRTEKVVGFEALIRWNHPNKGTILPDDFIPVAEESSLIRDLGDFVLNRVCRDINDWRKSGFSNVKVSINYSASQISQENFVEKILGQLSNHQLPTSCIEIEITEDSLMNHISHLALKLRQLKSKGIEIAVDDFGTGYSSFNYLQKFPIDTLKIDKSFIHSIHEKKTGTSIVNAIISMARGLELNLVAEGVETDRQYEYLKQLGCPEIQGWLFGKPESAEHTKELLNEILRPASSLVSTTTANPIPDGTPES